MLPFGILKYMLPFRYTKCSSQILAWLGFMSSPSYFVNLMQAFVCNCICSVKRIILNKRAPIGATLEKTLVKTCLVFLSFTVRLFATKIILDSRNWEGRQRKWREEERKRERRGGIGDKWTTTKTISLLQNF